ncbi:MAG: leucyl/phenylalanyl-tRNA--protein transferase [Acidimicrobiales bacterium]
MPVEPPPTRWRFPDPNEADDIGVVGLGADLEPGTLLHAYRSGLFPMPVDETGSLAWWSPDPRGVLMLDHLRVSRSLRRSCERYDIRIDTAFDAVVAACADPRRAGGWISSPVQAAYTRLHTLGWAHSIEAWDEEGLAGGLYGIAVGGLFAGESMFHRRTDASKVALVALVDLLDDGAEGRLVDVQWTTEHLSSLGVADVPRPEYLERLRIAIALPLPAVWAS